MVHRNHVMEQIVCDSEKKLDQENISEQGYESFDFASLLPELQVKILAQVDVKELRHCMLVSKEMRRLVEQNMQYLARGYIHYVGLSSGWLSYANGENIGEGTSGKIAYKEFSEISRIFLWCHIHMIQLNGSNLTQEFCDELRMVIRSGNWRIDIIWFYNCRFNPQENLSAFDRLLSASGASELIFSWGSSEMYSGKEFLSQYTVQQLELLGMNCEFSENEIMNGRFNRLCFERYCGITEHILRQIIEDWVECKKEVPDYFFHELGDVNVELILSGIPNIICRSQNLWTLTNSKDQTGCIYIYGDEFRLYTK